MNRVGPAGPWLPRPHAVTTAMFVGFARGDGGADGMRVLADAEYSRRLMTLWAIRRAAMRHGGDVDHRGRAAWQVLAAAQRRSPGAVRALITYPSLGPALLRSLSALTSGATGPDDGPAAVDPLHALTSLTAAAVVATGLRARVGLAVRGRRIVLPGVGAVRLTSPPGSARAVVGAGPSGAYVTLAEERIAVGPGPPRPGAAWQELRLLVPGDGSGHGLVLDDLDPYHAGIRSRSGRLSETDWRRWRRTVAAGWRVLRGEHAAVAAEAAVVLRALVPLTGPRGSQSSSSSKETFGAAALTLPETAEGMALTLSHELQHNKLSALLHLFDLVADRPGELFYAPWREDPRPLVGLLHGTYAHLGVARFWHRRMSRPTGVERHESEVQFARWRDVAGEAAGTLMASGRLTDDGAFFVARMRDALDELAHVPVTSAAAAEGAERAADHRRQWSGRHDPAVLGGRPR